MSGAATPEAPTLRKQHRAFGGKLGFWSHESAACGGPMRFAVYEPPQAVTGPVPVLWYLSGLTCTEENFMAKGGALGVAAELGLMLVAPDTSPRGCGYPGEDDDWDFGSGAGFYLDATREPWAARYRMETYVVHELPALVAAHFPTRTGPAGITGHSMGGHGALTLALKHPGRYASVSAFAPICAPTQCPWGRKAFAGYLGDDEEAWKDHDACELIRRRRLEVPLLVDQGGDDEFLEEQLNPYLLLGACAEVEAEIELRIHEGYDHSYYFVASFLEEHLRHHAAALGC